MTGYFPPPPGSSEDEAVRPPPPPILEEDEDLVQPSLQHWIDGPGTSSRHPGGTPPVSIESLPEGVKVLLAEHNSLVEKDFEELAKSMKEQGKAIMAKRGAELAFKMMELNKCHNEVADLSRKMSQLKKPSSDNDNVNVDPLPDLGGSPKKPSSPVPSAGHASTSSPANSADEGTKGHSTIEVNKDTETGPSTLDKRNRKKRKRVNVGLVPKKRKCKGDDDVADELWAKFLVKRAFVEGFKIMGQCQP